MLKLMNYAQLLIPDFSLILCGYLVCHYTKLDRTVWQQVDSLVYFFLFPVLLFHSIVRRPLDFAASSNFISASAILILVAIGLSFALAWLPNMDRREHAGAAQVAFRFNSYIALAVSERLGGVPGLQLMALLMGVSVPLCNAAAVWLMVRHSHAKNQPFWQVMVTNPLVIATASGLLANLLGLTIPTWSELTVTRVGQAALALGLLAAGAGMQLQKLGQTPALSLGVLGIRHLITPLVAYLLIILLGLDGLQATVLLAFSALPTASSAYVLATRMGYNGGYVAALVTMSTLLGMVSLPFALGVLSVK
jgi:malonate transporter and related proteins